MKKLDRLILKSFIGPLVLTFTIAVFVLLMQFVWKYIDDLVGKGLQFKVILELLLYASATFVPMALPISVLFASIMTMGNFGEKYELVAIKAGGISIRRVMMPMALLTLMLTGVAFYFANNVMPVAMLKYQTLLYDVTRKKPALNIRASEYYSDIDGYVIRINHKEEDGTLRDIILFDHTGGPEKSSVIIADHGLMQTSPDSRYLLFTLFDGCSYSEEYASDNFINRPLTSARFAQQQITFDISSFSFSKSDGGFFHGGSQMLNVSQLDSAIVSLSQARDKRYNDFASSLTDKMRSYLLVGNLPPSRPDTVYEPQKVYQEYDSQRKSRVKDQAINVCRLAMEDIHTYHQILQADSEYLNRHHVELQRKFTLSFACLLMFLIGAPFGSIVRKGGLGVPLVASVVFFVLYYVIGMIAEKAVRGGALPPVGMWMSSFVFLPIGLLLTLYATTDSALFDPARWHAWFQKRFKRR